MALVKPGGERTEHQVYETTDRTCTLCHRRVADVAEKYFVYEGKVCLCWDHRDADGIHGQFADRVDKPQNAFQVVRLMHSSVFKKGRNSRKREATVTKITAKEADEEFGDGDVTPEIAAFLKAMGKG